MVGLWGRHLLEEPGSSWHLIRPSLLQKRINNFLSNWSDISLTNKNFSPVNIPFQLFTLRQHTWSCLVYKAVTHIYCFFSHTGRLGRKFKKQLGGTKIIHFGIIPVPAGLFLEITAHGTAEVSVSLYKDRL